MGEKRRFWWGSLEAGGNLEDTKANYVYERKYSNES
jgi:hypothetical protein